LIAAFLFLALPSLNLEIHFSDFIRYASTSEKQTFFEKVRDLAIDDQRQVIAQTEEQRHQKANQDRLNNIAR